MDYHHISLKKIEYDLKKSPFIKLKYNNKYIKIKTPLCSVPFGIELYKKNYLLIKLCCVNYKQDKIMQDFVNFINNLEDEFTSILSNYFEKDMICIKQLNERKNSINGKEIISYYLTTILNNYNGKIKANIYKIDNFNKKYRVTSSEIDKSSNVNCIIGIDNIWHNDTHFVCKWKIYDLFLR